MLLRHFEELTIHTPTNIWLQFLLVEGSSRLGSNNKWGTFPAASLGWVMSEENFMYSIPAINFLKLRVGYGVTGNMPSDDYVALAMMGVTGRVYDHTSQSWVNAYGPTQNVNKDIKWEKKVNGISDWILRFKIIG